MIDIPILNCFHEKVIKFTKDARKKNFKIKIYSSRKGTSIAL